MTARQSTENDAPRRPTSETGIYLYTHKHRWAETGAKRYPVGTWHPVFRCERCGDVICDLSVEVDGPSPFPPATTEGGDA